MKIWSIFKRELQSYFYSPVAYIIFSSFLFVVGYLFWVVMVAQKLATLEPFFGNAAFVLLLISPMLTMRLISEEKRSNSLELLLTSPVSPAEIVMGKFLACFFLYLVLIVVSFKFPAIMYAYAQNLDWGPIISGYIGLVLLSAAFIGLGLFASCLAESQVTAAMVSFAGLILFWIIGWVKFAVEGPIGEAISKLSLIEHYSELVKGVVDSGNIIFFLAFTVVWLFLATRVLESERWR